MKPRLRRPLAAALSTSLLAGLVWTMTAAAATTYSDYAVYGDHGVFIGGNSEVVGLVGARHNNSPTVYPGQPPEALGMNGGATITGDARIDGNVNMANSTLISGTLYRSGTRNVNPNATVNNEVVGDPDLPAATLASQSVWPSGLGTGCPAGPSPFQTSFASNGVPITLTPGSYGEVKAGSNSNLIFDGTGDYYIERVQFGGGLTIQVNGPDVRVFVCEDVTLAGGVVSPAALLPNDFIVEVAGIGIAAGTNAFEATGFDWIGNLLVPTRGVHFGTGGGGATWFGYMWADHVDIEHGVVNTKAPKKSGTKFNDLNGNGIEEQGEPGLPGWTIYVDYDDDGILDANEPFGVTDANGYYEIVDIVPGTWKVREVQQAGWSCTLPATNDGKPDVAGGCYYEETFADGDNLTGNDFGNFQPAHKGGIKFDDLNGNGQKDQGESGLSGWTIELRQGLNVIDSKITEADGSYEFDIAAAGTYQVCEVQQGPAWIQTYPNASYPNPVPNSGKETVGTVCPGGAYGYEITVASGDSLIDNDFGNFKLGSKSGTKYLDSDNDGAAPFNGPLSGWVIHLLGPGGSDVSTPTLADGSYSFGALGPGTYTVCEELQANWSQTYPAGVTATDGTVCEVAGYAAGGYTFTITSGKDETGNDFANFQRLVESPPECQKQTVNDVMDLTYVGNGGPDETVLTYNGELVQSAVDTVTDVNSDGFLIVMVLAHADGSLGGTANQKVAVKGLFDAGSNTFVAYPKPFALFGCSVTLTGGGSDPAVWIKSGATSPSKTINGKATTIFVMDLHGGNSAIGVEADGTKRYLRNEGATNNTGIGIYVNGASNTVHNGSASGNGGDGIYVNGSSNYLTDTNSMSNRGNGLNVLGGSNQILKLDVGERGTGNSLDGIHVVGNTNTLQENDVFANAGDGIDIAGNSNILTKNVAGDRTKGNLGNGFLIVGYGNNLTENKASANGTPPAAGDGFNISGGTSAKPNLIKNNLSNTGGATSDLENLGKEWRFLNYIKNNGGGNRADGVLLANLTKGLTNFPASGSTYNYTVVQAAE